MYKQFIFLVTVAMLCAAVCRQGAAQNGTLPQDPRAVFDTAYPFYNFEDAGLRPWHLRASYQFYEEEGKPAKTGIFEYWWASPAVHRISWSRAGASYTEWYSADGNVSYRREGEPISFYEQHLKGAFLSPLPKPDERDAGKVRFMRDTLPTSSGTLPCVMVLPVMPVFANAQKPAMGLFPTYCFDPESPVLRTSFSFASLMVGFGQIVTFQKHYLPKDVDLLEGKRKILSAHMDVIEDLSPHDLDLAPPADAQVDKDGGRLQLNSGIAIGMLLKKVAPAYPADAKSARISGKVAMSATIARDGSVHDLRVVQAPSSSMAAAALQAASNWRYKPYLLNGQATDVYTTINMIFDLR